MSSVFTGIQQPSQEKKRIKYARLWNGQMRGCKLLILRAGGQQNPETFLERLASDDLGRREHSDVSAWPGIALIESGRVWQAFYCSAAIIEPAFDETITA